MKQRPERKYGAECVGATDPKLAIAWAASVTAAAKMNGRIRKGWIMVRRLGMRLG